MVSFVVEFIGDDCEEILCKLVNGELVEINLYLDVLVIKDGLEVMCVNV